LYAVSAQSNGLDAMVHTYDLPPRVAPHASTLIITGPKAVVPVVSHYDFTGRLVESDGAGIDGADVTLTKDGKDWGAAVTGVDGTFSVHHLVDQGVDPSYTIVASYAGDSRHAPAQSSPFTLQFSTKKPYLRAATTPHYVPAGGTTTVVVSLGRTDGNRVVSIYAMPGGTHEWVLIHRRAVDSTGHLRLPYRVGKRFVAFLVKFSGDRTYVPSETHAEVGIG
jgi:hypothetical protein